MLDVVGRILIRLCRMREIADELIASACGDRPARGRVRATRVGRVISVGSARRTVRRRRRPGCVVTRGCVRAKRAASIEAGRVCELLPKIGAAWRAGAITGGAAKTIAAAAGRGPRPEAPRTRRPVADPRRSADDQRELRRACAHFRNCAHGRRHRTARPRRVHDLGRLRRAEDVQAELSSSARRDRRDRHPRTHRPTVRGDPRTPARRRADALVPDGRTRPRQPRRRRPTGRPGPCPPCSIVDRLDHPHRRDLGPDRRRVHRHPPPHRRRTPPL